MTASTNEKKVAELEKLRAKTKSVRAAARTAAAAQGEKARGERLDAEIVSAKNAVANAEAALAANKGRAGVSTPAPAKTETKSPIKNDQE